MKVIDCDTLTYEPLKVSIDGKEMSSCQDPLFAVANSTSDMALHDVVSQTVLVLYIFFHFNYILGTLYLFLN